MASVQELLLAAQASKSPFQSLLEGAAQGFGQAQAGALDRTRTLIAMEQEREDRARALEEDKRIRAEIARRQEEKTQSALKDAAGPGSSAHPSGKLKEKFEKGKDGLYRSQSVEIVEPKEISYQKADYQDEKGRVRIGRWNPTTGRLERSPDDALAPSPTASGKEEPQPKQNEFAARNFSDMAQKAEQSLEALLSEGYDPSAVLSTRGEWIPNVAKTEGTQRFEQAARQFVQAVLRKESGATITPSEMAENLTKYFPSRGDAPSTIAQKAEARKLAIAGLQAEGSRVPSKVQPAVTAAPSPKGPLPKPGTTFQSGRFKVTVR